MLPRSQTARSKKNRVQPANSLQAKCFVSWVMTGSELVAVPNFRSSEGLIPLGEPEAGGRTGLLRGTDRSLTVAAPFILAKAHGHSLTVAARKTLRTNHFTEGVVSEAVWQALTGGTGPAPTGPVKAGGKRKAIREGELLLVAETNKEHAQQNQR